MKIKVQVFNDQGELVSEHELSELPETAVLPATVAKNGATPTAYVPDIVKQYVPDGPPEPYSEEAHSSEPAIIWTF